MKSKAVTGYVVALILLVFAGGWWTTTQNRPDSPHQVRIAGYSFGVGIDGDMEYTTADTTLKGVTIGSTQAGELKTTGTTAIPVTVEGSTDPGLDLEYVMFFEPFLRDSILGKADATLFPVADPADCVPGATPEGASAANKFYTQRTLESTDRDNPTRHHYCYLATVPSNPDAADFISAADESKEPDTRLSIRFQVQ